MNGFVLSIDTFSYIYIYIELEFSQRKFQYSNFHKENSSTRIFHFTHFTNEYSSTPYHYYNLSLCIYIYIYIHTHTHTTYGCCHSQLLVMIGIYHLHTLCTCFNKERGIDYSLSSSNTCN